MGTGIHCSFEAAIDRMVAGHKVFDPDPVDVDIYRRLYRRVYRKIYKTLAPLYADIKKITGYPA
jgi:hypothetical protein